VKKPPKLCRHIDLSREKALKCALDPYSLNVGCNDCAKVAAWLCDAYNEAIKEHTAKKITHKWVETRTGPMAEQARWTCELCGTRMKLERTGTGALREMFSTDGGVTWEHRKKRGPCPGKPEARAEKQVTS
jgi:transposase-like protein